MLSDSMGVDRDGRVAGMPKLLILIALVLLTGHACSKDNVYVRQALSDREGTVLVEFSRRQASGVYRRATSRYSFGWTDATEVLVEGFSTPELKGNTDFTWAIARHAKIRMWILDKDSDWLHLSIRPFVVDVDVPQVVSVGVNETNLGTVTLTSAGFSDYSLRLPTDVLKLGENVVTFDFVYTEMPRRVSESSRDTRTLAAAFDYIEITSNPRPAFEAARTPQALERSWIMSPDTMMLPSESEARFSIRVPVDGAIEFELERFLNDSPDTIRGEVLVSLPDSSPTDDELVFRSYANGGPWRADLSSWAGEHVDLVFRAVGGSATADIVWRVPRLFGDAGETDLRTNVVLIVVDTLRADYLGSYGGSAETRNIDGLAESGVRFEHAYSHVPITVPSHSSMFTSQIPTEHGALNNSSVLSSDHTTLAELLHDTYRETFGFVSLGVLKQRFGVAQGFDRYEDEFQADWWKNAEEINEQILPWLQRRRSEPFFLFAHYSDPHEPYAAPIREYPVVVALVDGEAVGEFAADGTTATVDLPVGTSVIELVSGANHSGQLLVLKNLRSRIEQDVVTCVSGCRERSPRPGTRQFVTQLPAKIEFNRDGSNSSALNSLRVQVNEVLSNEEAQERYREEVEYLDDSLGVLLAAIEAAVPREETIVILTSDHGEELGEHGSIGHVTRLYEPAIRVPLIISWPGQLPAGTVITEPVSHIDLLPTLVDLLAVQDSGRRSGQSLQPLWNSSSGTTFSVAPILAETFRPESPVDRKALLIDRFKLIETVQDASRELYDLENDPTESNNLVDQAPEIVDEFAKTLWERVGRAEANARTSEEQTLTDEQMQRLRSLGYVR